MHAAVSFWLETAGDLTPRSPLPGPADVDVAILGGGYTGLWTAWYLLQREPGLRLAVCEAEIAGFGASGRNGAWCSGSLGVSPGELARRTSDEVARRTVAAVRDAVDEVGRVTVAEGLEVGYQRTGALRVARGPGELPRLGSSWEMLRRLGLDDGCAWLDAAAVQQRARISRAEAAVFDPHCAVIHPGRLARGLATLVERTGGRIYEQTPVTEVVAGPPRPLLRTPHGDVRADVVVLAGEAWLSQLAGMRRAVLPVYSLVVLTEPLDAGQWEAVGWAGRECMGSQRLTVDYLSRTDDGRILLGGRGAPYHFGSRIRSGYDRHAPTHAALRRHLVDWFPALADVRFTHAWGGPLGVPRDWMPTFRYDPHVGVAGAWGYVGQGVAASNLAGRTLADLITGKDSELVHLPMVNHRSRRWEPEPLRWLGARYVQQALARIDQRGRPPSGRSLAERLTRH